MGPLDVIRMAIEKSEVVIILYQPKGKRDQVRMPKRYETEPYEMKIKKGKLYYYAWNITSGHVASFLAGRILSAELTATPFISRPEVRSWLKDVLG